MQNPRPREDEARSLEALRSLDVLDSAPESAFDALVRAASLVCDVPIALISLLDAERQWFKANVGLAGVTETPREVSFCAHAVLGESLFEVPDAALDPRFTGNPLVANDPGIRFYAGVPLRLDDGSNIGTLCVIDREPRSLSSAQREILCNLAVAAVQALELRRSARAFAASEDRFRNNQRLLRHVVDNVPALIAHVDADLRYTMVNQAYVEWDPPSSSDPVGRHVSEVHGEHDFALLADELDRALRGQRRNFEVQLHPGGETRAMQVTYVPETDARGRVTGLFSMKVDVTALRRTEMRLRQVMEVAPHGMFMSDLDGRCTYTNAAWQRIAGLTLQQSMGDGMRRIVHPDDLEQLLAIRRKALEEGGVSESEHRYLRLDGTTVWVRGHITVLRVDGVPDSFVGTVEDVTERRRLNQALAERNAALARANLDLDRLGREQAAMLDNDLVGIVKLRGRTAVWTNRGLERIFGYGAGELINQPSRMLYVDDDSHLALGESAYPTLHAGGEHRVQLQMRRKDGALIWIDMSGFLLSESLGESMWLLVDITALKEAELSRLRAVELEAENRQLQEASRLKGMFLSNMSHELRTPLNAVIGFAGLLESGAVSPDAPKFKTYLGQIGTSGKELLRLIDTVLDFGQAEAGRIEFRTEHVRLPELLREVVEIQRDAASRKQAEVITEIEPSVAELFIDPMRLKQVLSCYVSNAIKFTGGPSRVKIRAQSEGSECVRIEVEDNGIGIAEIDQPKLFKEFQQLSTGSTKAYQGTGMGLALARRLIEAQGGSVGVRSVLGSGSVFYLVLPCRRVTDAQRAR